MKQEDSNQSRASGSRRTRSQIGPDWTLKDSLILVNEIVAVEGDCQNALSSFQKWNIIADNCTVLDVPRTSYQCRRKWDSLLDEYSQIKKWESQSRNNLFCSLEGDRRKEFGLPEIFDDELFKAIDDHIRAQNAQPDTDSDSDPDAEADTVDVIEEIGPKKLKRRLRTPESRREGKLPKHNSCKDQKPLQSRSETKPLRSCYEEKRQNSRTKEKPQKSRNEEMQQKGVYEEVQQKGIVNEEVQQKGIVNEEVQQKCVNEETQQKSNSGESAEESFSEEEDASGEEKEQMMMAKLRENAEFIHAIANGKTNEKPDYRAFGLKNVKNFQADSVRRKGDALIACLSEISNTLHQLCVNIQNCD